MTKDDYDRKSRAIRAAYLSWINRRMYTIDEPIRVILRGYMDLAMSEFAKEIAELTLKAKSEEPKEPKE